MQRLSEEEVQSCLTQLIGWKLTDEKWIYKKYRFKEFLLGISFVTKIAEFSEEVNHHPFFIIDYKVVTLKLSSWQAGGLTDLDIRLAHQYDRIFHALTTPDHSS